METGHQVSSQWNVVGIKYFWEYKDSQLFHSGTIPYLQLHNVYTTITQCTIYTVITWDT